MSHVVSHGEKVGDSLHRYNFDKRLLDQIYCPTCKDRLSRVELVDVFVQGLKCGNGHRFFIPLIEVLLSETEKCPLLESVEDRSSDPLKIIRIWLSDVNYRSKLNGQLALILRRIYEIKTNNLHNKKDATSGAEAIFKFCPICMNPLVKFEQDDIWVQGLKCSEGHEYFARNGIHFFVEGELVELHDEIADSTMLSLVKSWLQDKKVLKSQLHYQIKMILENYSKDNSP